MILILTTIHKKPDAVKIGAGLLKEKLIACYNLLPADSAYWWKGKILKEKEILMILKTRNSNFKKVEAFIKKHSDYEVPEIIAITPKAVNAGYLNWIDEETS